MSGKVSVDTELVEEAEKFGNHGSKREAATRALEYYVACLQRQQMADPTGAPGFAPEHDGPPD